ncbi:MAG TPA: MarR family transcriptional regulator [Pseudonocardia sp.]|jgi:DNA-binding MarR family transcriptional regulator|uniref:MarR family winged helix-turn-helix transcriptional regulator n=1 Tax=Pseudonocardia sp. TaxID=60912 RepID=UPI002ED7C66C
MTTLPVTQEHDLDFARLLTLVERTVAQRLAGVLKTNGATIEEWRVLSFLGDVGHTMTEIAEFAMVQAPTLTKLIDRMVSANLVLRRVDDADRRRVLVHASDRGRQAVREWTVLVRREHDDLVTVVGSEEINLLKALLARVSARLA